jgi:hypothetical protein
MQKFQSEKTRLTSKPVGLWQRIKNYWSTEEKKPLNESINNDDAMEMGTSQYPEANQESKWWNLWYAARWVLPGGTGWKVGWAGLMAILIAGGPAFLAAFWGGLLKSFIVHEIIATIIFI